MDIRFSVIVPVYNRPDEVEELLASLSLQTYKNFEVIIVEDGSSVPCGDVVARYESALEVHYFTKANSGPGPTRNYGAERCSGDYLLFLDSDCVVPQAWLEEVVRELVAAPVDAFGGPDRADKSFTDIQKAINYSMTSFFTTGGIRGGKKRLDKFYPRSFNLGVSRSAFTALEGFAAMRFGEDIDLSLRIYKAGYTCRLFPEAWVYHKRRTDVKKFFKQVYNSGMARISLWKKHPGSLKAVHLLPAAFVLGVCALVLLSIVHYAFIFPVIFYAILVFADSALKNRSLRIGLLSIITAFVQLFAYGCGFIVAFWKGIILKQSGLTAFEKTFYK
jgi:glycosyltransferase involved in cell wall biosynthesis